MKIKLMDVIKSSTNRQKQSMVVVGLTAFFFFLFHFLLEFYVIFSRDLSLYTAVLHYIGLIIGFTFERVWIGKKLHPSIHVVIGLLGMAISFSLMVIIQANWIIYVGLTSGGISIGIMFGACMLIVRTILNENTIQVNGKLYSIVYSISFILISVFIIGKILTRPILSAIIIGIFVGVILLFIAGWKENLDSLGPQKYLKWKEFFGKKKNIILSVFGICYGFFFVNNYFVAIQFLELNNVLEDFFEIFLISLSISVVITSIIGGIIADTFGRRITFIIGIFIQSIAFLVISFFPDNLNILTIYFPIILGLGLSLTIPISQLLYFENSPLEEMRARHSYFIFFVGIGNIIGILIALAFNTPFSENPAYVTLVLVIFFLFATIFVFQIDETLPSKEELKWKHSLQYLYVIKKSGLSLYSQDLCELQNTGKKCDELLLGGAITAINMLMKEIAADKSPLKLIEHDEFCLMIEEGTHIYCVVVSLSNLNGIRKKMRQFVEEFEHFFETPLNRKYAEMNYYLPTEKLIEKIFK